MIDYATKYWLAATITPTARGQDALAYLLAAVRHAQGLLGLDDLRSGRGELDLIDETAGELLRAVSPHGSLLVTRRDAADGPRGNAARTLPVEYVARHVELAYATTAHGAQGSTTTSAHVVFEDQSTAAAAYVAMTRGRQANTAEQAARAASEQAEAALRGSTTRIDAETVLARDTMLAAWDAQRRAAEVHARTALRGPGRLGLKLLAVRHAQEELARWSVAWQPIIVEMPHAHEEIARYADGWENRPRIHTAFENYARTLAETRHPEHSVLLAAAERAREQAVRASQAVWDAKGDYHDQLAGHFTVCRAGSGRAADRTRPANDRHP